MSMGKEMDISYHKAPKSSSLQSEKFLILLENSKIPFIIGGRKRRREVGNLDYSTLGFYTQYHYLLGLWPWPGSRLGSFSFS